MLFDKSMALGILGIVFYPIVALGGMGKVFIDYVTDDCEDLLSIDEFLSPCLLLKGIWGECCRDIE